MYQSLTTKAGAAQVPPRTRTSSYTALLSRVPTARDPSFLVTFVAIRRSPWKIVTVPICLPSWLCSAKTSFLIESTISCRRLSKSPPYRIPRSPPRESRIGTAAATTIPSDRNFSSVGFAAGVGRRSNRASSANSVPSRVRLRDERTIVPDTGFRACMTLATRKLFDRSSPIRPGLRAR